MQKSAVHMFIKDKRTKVQKYKRSQLSFGLTLTLSKREGTCMI